MSTLAEVDRKLDVVLKELGIIKGGLKKVRSDIEQIQLGDDGGMTYMVGGQIQGKLDQILERLAQMP